MANVTAHRSRWPVALITAIYALLYLYAIGDLNLQVTMATSLRTMPDPASLMWQRRIGVQFEGIAILSVPGLLWLVSPVNTVIGLVLGALVGINAVLGYRAYHQRQCAIGGTTASVATLPALLSGAACCAPVTLLALGIPVTASVMTLFQWLVPFAALLLVASALWLHRQTL